VFLTLSFVKKDILFSLCNNTEIIYENSWFY